MDPVCVLLEARGVKKKKKKKGKVEAKDEDRADETGGETHTRTLDHQWKENGGRG